MKNNRLKSPITSPRASSKEPPKLGDIYKKRIIYNNNNSSRSLTPDVKLFEQFGKIILKSMSIGQPMCVLCTMYYNKDYEDQKQELLFGKKKNKLFSPPVFDLFTKRQLFDSQNNPIRFKMLPKMKQIIDWITKQGYTTILLCKQVGKMFLGDPKLSDWAHLAVYPNITNEKSGYLSNVWKTQHMIKCVDKSKFDDWYERIKSSFLAGQVSPVALCVLYDDSDYGKEKGETNTLVCQEPVIINWMTGASNHRTYYLNVKFDLMLSWVQQQGLHWTLGFPDPIENWAYFMVYYKNML